MRPLIDKSIGRPITSHDKGLEWATLANGNLYTAHTPIDKEGYIVEGDAAAQTWQALDNVTQAVESAGGNINDISQLLIYVTDEKHLSTVNDVYHQYFQTTPPNRNTLIIPKFTQSAIMVEIIAYAYIS